MSYSLTEDFKTLAELQSEAARILEQLQKTGRPVVITVAGKPAAVLLDVETFERKLKAVNMAHLIAEAEASMRVHGSRPVDEFFDELERGQKVSRANRSKGRK
jgi:prevent-host-death family protein